MGDAQGYILTPQRCDDLDHIGSGLKLNSYPGR
jgi:hypothetical protein